MAIAVGRRKNASYAGLRKDLERGLDAIALSREPQIPQPFPYTWSWGLILIALLGAAYILLWTNARPSSRQRGVNIPDITKAKNSILAFVTHWRTSLLKFYRAKSQETLPL